MPVSFIFRCQFCDAQPDPLTQLRLQAAMREFVAFLREHYGTIGFHLWKRPPYPNSLESSDTDHAWITATRRQRWSGF